MNTDELNTITRLCSPVVILEVGYKCTVVVDTVGSRFIVHFGSDRGDFWA